MWHPSTSIFPDLKATDFHKLNKKHVTEDLSVIIRYFNYNGKRRIYAKLL